MAYRRKYRKGKQITSLDELVKQEFVYYYDKIYHRGWVGSWQLSWVERMLAHGKLFYAVKEDEERSKECEKSHD